jgi:hypothetical protein
MIALDVIHDCISLVPVPYLATAFSLFKFIWTSVEGAQASKEQLRVLSSCIAQLLVVANKQCSGDQLCEANMVEALDNLCGCVRHFH